MFLGFIFRKGSERTILVKKNILYSFVLQGITILCSFFLVPLTLNYLSADQYGVWLTLNSIMTWLSVCEIGISMGLKNKLGEALAVKDYELGKKYVSVTYALLFLITIIFMIVFLCLNSFIDWSKILNISTLSSNSLSIVVLIVVVSFCLIFVFKTIGVVLAADQRVAYSSIMGVMGSLISLVIIWILTKTTAPSLLYVALAFSFVPVIVNILGSAYFYSGRYKSIRPSLRTVDFSYAKGLVGLSLGFFILQISGIIVFTTANMIITQTIGPEEVSVYNICFKYYNIVTLSFNLILGPMWPAYTNAFAMGDIEWIKKGMKKLRLIWAAITLGTIIMFLCSPIFFKLWVGDSVSIPLSLSLLMAIYVVIGNWNNIYAQLLAGVGKIRLSIINSAINAIIFIPICIYFSKEFGVKGVTIAMTITILTSTFWQPIQCIKLIKGTAKGIWNK